MTFYGNNCKKLRRDFNCDFLNHTILTFFPHNCDCTCAFITI